MPKIFHNNIGQKHKGGPNRNLVQRHPERQKWAGGSQFIYVHFIYISISRYGELYDRRKNPAPSAQIPVPEMYMK